MKRRRCYLCGTPIPERYTWCKPCAQKYGMYKQPRALWEPWSLRLARLVDREWKEWTHHQHVDLDAERGQHVSARMSYAHYQRDLFLLPLDVVLYKYHLTLDEYDILTEKANLLAPRMGISRKTIYNRRAKLKKRVLAEGILQLTLDARGARGSSSAEKGIMGCPGNIAR